MATPFDQVSAAVARVQRELVLARFLGKIAVDQGLAEVRSRLEAAVFPVPPEERGADTTDQETSDTGAAALGDDGGRGPTPGLVDADELALADYDSLPASDIVAKLSGLDPDELDAIERYELAHRERRTVLGRIRQLRAS